MPATTRELPRDEWKSYFNRFYRHSVNHQIEFEVIGLDIGDQIKEEWAELKGITYDHEDDALYVMTDPVVHRIQRPVKIFVIEDNGKWGTINVIDHSGFSQIIKLKEPVMFQEAS